jgi:hypothetical protein
MGSLCKITDGLRTEQRTEQMEIDYRRHTLINADIIISKQTETQLQTESYFRHEQQLYLGNQRKKSSTAAQSAQCTGYRLEDRGLISGRDKSFFSSQHPDRLWVRIRVLARGKAAGALSLAHISAYSYG